MNGNFEVSKSSYPIAAMPVGEGKYKITNMIYMEPLHDGTIAMAHASEIASQANAMHRASREEGWREHGVRQDVKDWVAAQVAKAQ